MKIFGQILKLAEAALKREAATLGPDAVALLALSDLARRIDPADVPLFMERLAKGWKPAEIILGEQRPDGEWDEMTLLEIVSKPTIRLRRPDATKPTNHSPPEDASGVYVTEFNVLTGEISTRQITIPVKFKAGDRVRLLQDVEAKNPDGSTSRPLQRFERGTVESVCGCGCGRVFLKMDVLPPDMGFQTHEDRVELVPAAEVPERQTNGTVARGQKNDPAFRKPTEVTPPRDVRIVPADRPEGT